LTINKGARKTLAPLLFYSPILPLAYRRGGRGVRLLLIPLLNLLIDIINHLVSQFIL
jgi:hypothetical protein